MTHVMTFEDSRRKGEREQFLRLVEAQRNGHTHDIVPRDMDFSAMVEEMSKDEGKPFAQK